MKYNDAALKYNDAFENNKFSGGVAWPLHLVILATQNISWAGRARGATSSTTWPAARRAARSLRSGARKRRAIRRPSWAPHSPRGCDLHFVVKSFMRNGRKKTPFVICISYIYPIYAYALLFLDFTESPTRFLHYAQRTASGPSVGFSNLMSNMCFVIVCKRSTFLST